MPAVPERTYPMPAGTTVSYPADSSPCVVLVFASGEAAGYRVAGLPAVGRAVREVARAGVADCWLVVEDGWSPEPATCDEIWRLADRMQVHGLGAGASGRRPAGTTDVAMPAADRRVLFVSGEELVPADAIRAALESGPLPQSGLVLGQFGDVAARRRLDRGESREQIAARLDAVGRAVLAATARADEGFLYRHINRPISRTITGLLLRHNGFRPIHGTFGSAILGLAMFAVLVGARGQAGLIAGAALLVVASVFNGVDGEVARATFRDTYFGAMIDRIVASATRMAFISGVAINLFRDGHGRAALIGAAGLTMMVAGLAIVGRRARQTGGPLAFTGWHGDEAQAAPFPTGLQRRQGWLAMREFSELAALVAVAADLTVPAMIAFSVVMAGWLAVVLAAGFERPASA